MRDNCPCLYSQSKLLRDGFWYTVKFPLLWEHKVVPSWNHSIWKTDNPFWDDDTLQLRVTSLPHSAGTLGLTSSTNSVDKDTNLYWDLMETMASRCFLHILKRALLSKEYYTLILKGLFQQQTSLKSFYTYLVLWEWEQVVARQVDAMLWAPLSAAFTLTQRTIKLKQNSV